MANVKISNLPPAGAITGSELVPVVQNAGTKQTTVSAITAAANAAASAAAASAATKVASVSASAPLASSGGTTPIISLTGTVPVANGGTGQTTYTDGQLLIGNSTGNTLTKATLTAGAGVTITNGPGSITIAVSLTGGAQDYIVQSYGIV